MCWGPPVYRPWAPQLNSCHGDQALNPSEYSDDDVESFVLGVGTVRRLRPRACASACACACAWPCWPAPCFPILSLCFFPPKPQVPGSEVEIWLAPRQGTSRARRPRWLHLGWGPFRSVGTGGCARIDDAAFHFPIGPPLPRPVLIRRPALPCPALPAPSASKAWLPWLPWLPWHRGCPWCLGPGRHLLIRIQYTPHPQTQARIL